MDNNFFRNELHQYIDYCYDGFCKYQKIVNDIFKVFHEICLKNKIRYYLSFGTLLGRIRDGNQIPWDYDCDVCIHIEDVKTLLLLLDKFLPNDLFLDSNFTNKHCPVYMIRIGKKGYDINHLHLDIFYLLPVEKKQIKIQKKVASIFKKRVMLLYDFGKKSMKYKLLNLFRRIKCFPSTVFSLNFQFMRMISRKNKKVDFYIVIGDHAEIFENSIFSEPLLMIDKYGEYFAPTKPEQFLKERYGDYNNYLPIKDRFEEFYKFYILIKDGENE